MAGEVQARHSGVVVGGTPYGGIRGSHRGAQRLAETLPSVVHQCLRFSTLVAHHVKTVTGMFNGLAPRWKTRPVLKGEF